MELNKGVIICAIFFFGVASVSTLNNASSQNKGGFTLYNNTDFGIQVLYPQNWVAVEGDEKPGDFRTDVVILEPIGEQGKHFTQKFICGEVCLLVSIDNRQAVEGSSLEQYSDIIYKDFHDHSKGFKLLNYNSHFKLGDKKAFDILFQMKQGNRDYVQRLIGTNYDEKNFIVLQFKSRTKFSDQVIPLGQTMINSFKFSNSTTK